MDLLTLFGLLAVTAMLVTYALEYWSPWFILAFAGACLLGSPTASYRAPGHSACWRLSGRVWPPGAGGKRPPWPKRSSEPFRNANVAVRWT